MGAADFIYSQPYCPQCPATMALSSSPFECPAAPVALGPIHLAPCCQPSMVEGCPFASNQIPALTVMCDGIPCQLAALSRGSKLGDLCSASVAVL